VAPFGDTAEALAELELVIHRDLQRS
jgi:hypothetical protein